MTTPAQQGRASTASHFYCTLTVAGVGGPFVFDTFTGGTVSAEVNKRRAGGSRGKRATLGGPREVEDVTMAREFVGPRDHDLGTQLEAVAGSAECVATRQPTDANGVPYGRVKTYTGILQAVAYPEADSDSSDVSMLEVTVVVEDVA